MRSGLPFGALGLGAGQKIGLLGGSFDPAHMAHLMISREAIKRFDLDWVWWLVSPGNPLKQDDPASLERRLSHARGFVDDPRIVITDIERHLGTRYTARTLAALTQSYPHLRFTWLMGSDNLAQFHHWRHWQAIMEMLPVGVLGRPGSRMAARLSPAARSYARQRLPGTASKLLSQSDAPVWCFVDVPLDPTSSTAIRARGGWG